MLCKRCTFVRTVVMLPANARIVFWKRFFSPRRACDWTRAPPAVIGPPPAPPSSYHPKGGPIGMDIFRPRSLGEIFHIGTTCCRPLAPLCRPVEAGEIHAEVKTLAPRSHRKPLLGDAVVAGQAAGVTEQPGAHPHERGGQRALRPLVLVQMHAHQVLKYSGRPSSLPMPSRAGQRACKQHLAKTRNQWVGTASGIKCERTGKLAEAIAPSNAEQEREKGMQAGQGRGHASRARPSSRVDWQARPAESSASEQACWRLCNRGGYQDNRKRCVRTCGGLVEETIQCVPRNDLTSNSQADLRKIRKGIRTVQDVTRLVAVGGKLCQSKRNGITTKQCRQRWGRRLARMTYWASLHNALYWLGKCSMWGT
jgi:hypothetical protein